MALKAVPIDMISAPNSYAPLADGLWTITDPNAQTLWLRLDVVDAMGQRPFIPAAGSTLQITFQRADLIAMNAPNRQLVNTAQSVIKNGTANTDNRSLWSFALTLEDVKKALSGTVKYELTQSGIKTTWVQNWNVKKTLTDPGH